MLGWDFPAGFEVKGRGENAEGWVTLNEDLLPPQSSRYLDRGTEGDTVYSYLLTVIETSGARHDFGPVEVRHGGRENERPALYNAFPNPVETGVEVTSTLDLPSAQTVTLAVYDLAGRLVAALVADELTAGRNKVQWSTEGIASGAYHCRLTVGNQTFSSRSIVAR